MDRRDFQVSLLALLGTAIATPLASQVQAQAQAKPKYGNQQFRAVAKKVLDRIARDPAFRKQLLDNPERALIDAGFEKELQAISVNATATECSKTCGYRSCTRTCIGTCHLSCKVVATF